MARLTTAFDEPFAIDGTDLHVTASIGVALSGGGDDGAALIHAADAAMYRVKHDPAEGDREGPATPVLHSAVGEPKLEQLISRLLDLVSGGPAVESPPDRRQSPPPPPERHARSGVPPKLLACGQRRPDPAFRSTPRNAHTQ